MMSPEFTETDPFADISHPEAGNLETAAFLGALDDLFDEFTQDTPDRRSDDQIMQMITGIRDQASEYYSAERNQALDLLAVVSQRLGEMACSHDHFRQSLEAKTGELFGRQDELGIASESAEAADDDDDEEDEHWFWRRRKSSKT